MLTDSEKALINQYNATQALLAPFKRITDHWGVRTTHKFQDRIRTIDLVASGDLEDNWSIRVLARDTGVIVAEFSFPEYGRLFDMRRVDYTKPIPASALEPWVESKIAQHQIKYSKLADRLNVSFSDPRVIHDLAFRIARSSKFNLKRRRWYNKGKESSLDDLYTQLQEAMREAVIIGMKGDIGTRRQSAA